jgi:glyoxylase-like metal-dependent hydrolase (beta-lactamase superfamily II)
MIQIEQVGEVKKFRMARSILGQALYYTTCYWLDGLVIDTGCSYTARELDAALSGLPIDYIVNTHSHEDHIGANAALQIRHGAQIFAHSLALPVLSDPRKMQPLQPYQKILWGMPHPSEGAEINRKVETGHYLFEVIHTPGHSPDHICLYEPTRGWLFTGDAYTGGKDRALRHDYDIWQIIASLEKMADLDVEILFPGSGTVRERPIEEIKSKIDYLKDKGDQVLSLHSLGLSYRKIRQRLFGGEMPIAYYTLGHFSGKNLVRSYIVNQSQNPT